MFLYHISDTGQSVFSSVHSHSHIQCNEEVMSNEGKANKDSVILDHEITEWRDLKRQLFNPLMREMVLLKLTAPFHLTEHST